MPTTYNYTVAFINTNVFSLGNQNWHRPMVPGAINKYSIIN